MTSLSTPRHWRDAARHDGTAACRALPGSRDIATAETAFGQGEITALECGSLRSEIESELKNGDPAALITLALADMQEHGLCSSATSKAEQAEPLLPDRPDMPGVAMARVPRLDPQMGGGEVLRAVVRACLEQILANTSAVAGGRYDAEHTHQLCAGIRRLRTAWRELGALADAGDSTLEPVLVAALRELSTHRDQEEALSAIRGHLEASGGPDVDWPQPPEVARDPVQTVHDPVFEAALLQLIEFTRSRADAAGVASAKAVRKHVRRRLQALLGQVVRDRARFESLDEVQQHRVRKRLRRLRDLTDLVSSLYGRRAVDRFLDALKPAQDALGEHHDSLVALALYERTAREHDLRAWYAVGWLRARSNETARHCRRALREVANAEPFW